MLLQLITLALGVLDIIGSSEWAGMASTLGLIQGWLKSLLRDVTSEPIDKSKPTDVASVSIVALFGIALMLTTIGCATTGPYPEPECKQSQEIPEDLKEIFSKFPKESKINFCECSAVVFPIDKHPSKGKPAGIVTIQCNGKTLPFAVVTDDVSVPRSASAPSE